MSSSRETPKSTDRILWPKEKHITTIAATVQHIIHEADPPRFTDENVRIVRAQNYVTGDEFILKEYPYDPDTAWLEIWQVDYEYEDPESGLCPLDIYEILYPAITPCYRTNYICKMIRARLCSKLTTRN